MRKLDWILFRMPVAAIFLVVIILFNRPDAAQGNLFVQLMEGSRLVAEKAGTGVSWVLWLLMPLVILLSPAALVYAIWQHREGGPYVLEREARNKAIEDARRLAREHPITPEQLEGLRKQFHQPKHSD